MLFVICFSLCLHLSAKICANIAVICNVHCKIMVKSNLTNKPHKIKATISNVQHIKWFLYLIYYMRDFLQNPFYKKQADYVRLSQMRTHWFKSHFVHRSALSKKVVSSAIIPRPFSDSDDFIYDFFTSSSSFNWTINQLWHIVPSRDLRLLWWAPLFTCPT